MDVTLDSVIRGYLVSQGKNTLHGYLRLMKFAVEFLTGFAQDFPFSIKTVQLKTDEKRSCQFPDDLLRVNKVGIGLQDRILVFQYDSTINLFHSTEDDNPSGTINQSFTGTLLIPSKTGILNNFYLNGELGYLTGELGHNGVGYYKINHETKEIQLSTDVPSGSNIYLEYQSLGFNPSTKTVIPRQVALLCEKYIHWQVGQAKLGDSSSEAQARKLSYDMEKQNVITRMYPIQYEDIVGAASRSFDRRRITR